MLFFRVFSSCIPIIESWKICSEPLYRSKSAWHITWQSPAASPWADQVRPASPSLQIYAELRLVASFGESITRKKKQGLARLLGWKTLISAIAFKALYISGRT